MIQKLKKWRQRRRENEATQRNLELREFIYLDEVSVTSLLSSRLGKVPSEFTETITDSMKAELNSSIAANAAVAKASIGSRLESNRTEDTKVVSKATIQATFKRLFEMEEKSLVLRPVVATELAPSREAAQKMTTAADGSFIPPWRVPSEWLIRGSLIELEVELQADPAFRVNTIISSFAELANESKTLRSYADQGDFERALELNNVLAKLMVGLVPLRCRVLDYVAVATSHGSVLLHRRILDQLTPDERPSCQDVFLVGVAETALFWKDIRRVLFSKSRFRVLCRVNGDGLSSSWTPVKLVDVLGEVTPDLERQVGMLGAGALKTMVAGASQHKFIEPRLRALTTFGELVATKLGVKLGDDERKRIERIASESADLLTSVPESRKAFTEVVDFLKSRTSGTIDAVEVARMRVSACAQHNLLPGGATSIVESVILPEIAGPDNERFIEAEIIAIYW